MKKGSSEKQGWRILMILPKGSKAVAKEKVLLRFARQPRGGRRTDR
jgi:hypothetical protein